MAGATLVSATIGKDEATGLWNYQVRSTDHTESRLVLYDFGFDSDYEAAVALNSRAQEADIDLNPLVEVPAGPDKEERRRRFGDLLTALTECEHPAASFIKRNAANDKQFLTTMTSYAQTYGLREPRVIVRLHCLIGSSLEALAVALFADLRTLAELASADQDELSKKTLEHAAEYLWLSSRDTEMLFLRGTYTQSFEKRLADGELDFSHVLKVWKYYLRAKDMCWEITAPKPANLMNSVVAKLTEQYTAFHIRSSGIDGEEAADITQRMRALIEEVADYNSESGVPLFDVRVSKDGIKMLGEHHGDTISWKSFPARAA